MTELVRWESSENARGALLCAAGIEGGRENRTVAGVDDTREPAMGAALVGPGRSPCPGAYLKRFRPAGAVIWCAFRGGPKGHSPGLDLYEPR